MILAMSTDDSANPYVAGEPHANQLGYAAFEFKQSDPDSTGGGYPRWRSYEFRPATSGTEKEDVYVPVHRLCAVAWLFEDVRTAEDILLSGELVGADVHHELGMPSANLEDELSVRDHGRHSEITQRQRRAWAEDKKREVEEKQSRPVDEDECDRCGAVEKTLATCDAWPGEERCIDCARATHNGEEIRL
jgi:hypothetical protein